MEQRRAINQYSCDTCAGVITTVNTVEGVTPMFLTCKATAACPGRMISAMYRVPDNAVPRWEWYRPEGSELERLIQECPDWKEHVAKGGLAIRRMSPLKARSRGRKKKSEFWRP